MKIHIELEDNIVKPCKKTSFLNSEAKKTLQSMEKGQSFIVKKSSQVQHIQVYGRSVGKRFSSRKIYTGERQDTNFHFRVWLEGDREPITRKLMTTPRTNLSLLGRCLRKHQSQMVRAVRLNALRFQMIF
jgi:hypothetical protein